MGEAAKSVQYPRPAETLALLQEERKEAMEWYEQVLENARIIDEETKNRQQLKAFFDEELKRNPSDAGAYTVLYFQNQEAIQLLELRRREMEDVRKILEKAFDIA